MPNTTENTERCCGSCSHFDSEDSLGNGECMCPFVIGFSAPFIGEDRHCSDSCDYFIERTGGKDKTM